MQHGIEPRFEFGFGLSYNFEYSRLSITRLPTNGGDIAATRLGIVGKPVLRSKAAPLLLGEYTSLSIVLPCPDSSMKASPSLISGFVLYQEHW